MTNCQHFHTSGFTLVEMAIVLTIMALVMGSGLTVLTVQQDQRRIEVTKTLLDEARELLTGYALSHTALDNHPYLPCPDRTSGSAGGNFSNDGLEDRTAGVCDTQEGNFPWVTLGISTQTDPWSNRLRYRVTALFSNSTTGMLLTSSGDINVLDTASGGNILASGIPAIVVSHGKNGYGAINAAGNSNPAPPATHTDEQGNTNGTPFVSHTMTPTESVGGEFDDQLTWLSPYLLFNRMLQAGKLP